MFNFDLHILIWSLLIFISLLLQMLVCSMRLIFMVKENRTLTSIAGFFEAAIGITISITVIANAVKSGLNVPIILFYSMGFAAGLFLGMSISKKILKDMVSVNIVARLSGNDIENRLREYGFGATSYIGGGKDGDVKILNIICKKSNLEKLKFIVVQIDPKSMLTSHTIESLRGGFINDIKSSF